MTETLLTIAAWIIGILLVLGIMSALWEAGGWGIVADIVIVLAVGYYLYIKGWLWWLLGFLIFMGIGYEEDKRKKDKSSDRSRSRNTGTSSRNNNRRGQNNVYRTNTQSNNTSSSRKKYNLPNAE